MNSSALAEWIARHRRSLLFLLLLPVVAGIGAAFSLPVALFPNIQFPRVRISLDAGDRPAQQMVLQVTTPVEQALLGVPRLTDVRSANEP
jgi:multidrug efflux pump subunit AcrB